MSIPPEERGGNAMHDKDRDPSQPAETYSALDGSDESFATQSNGSAPLAIESDSQLPDTLPPVTQSENTETLPAESDSQLLDTIPFETQSFDNDGLAIEHDNLLPHTYTAGREPPLLWPTISNVPDDLDNENALTSGTQPIDSDTSTPSPTKQDLFQTDEDLPDTQPNTGEEAATSSDTDNPHSHAEKCTCHHAIIPSLDSPDILTKSSGISFQSIDFKTTCIQSSQAKVPFNKVTVRERKRIVVSSSRPIALTKAMCQWVDKTNYLLDPFREDDDCWFHPSPPAGHLSSAGILRPCGKLQKRFNWADRNGKHTIVLNFGIASKLVNYKMTKQQADGFINKQWHLSHLCGNWTCLNPAHTTVEPGNVNIGRNNCFSHRSGCFHNPPCMKDKKVPIGADGRLIDHHTSISYSAGSGVGWDDFYVQGFDDGDEASQMGDFDESETRTYPNSGSDLASLIDLTGADDE